MNWEYEDREYANASNNVQTLSECQRRWTRTFGSVEEFDWVGTACLIEDEGDE